MNSFRFQRELDVRFLKNTFGEDLFAAREVFGSFVELAEHETRILEASLAHDKYTEFARVAEGLKNALGMVGMQNELRSVDEIRSHLAAYGVNSRLIDLCQRFVEALQEKTSLLKIEVHRMNNHIEKKVNS